MSKLKIEIDENSGFCFGVVTAIKKAEEALEEERQLYCLGDIVHNGSEVSRLEKLGLKTINHEEFKQLRNVKVLLRAHGEPPSTYEIAKQNNISLIDATCPVVLQLQKKIKKEFDQTDNNQTQIAIFGKKGHAEVNGLVGQTNGHAIIIEKKEDLGQINFSKNISLFSQTTKSLDEFNQIIENIKKNVSENVICKFNDTICRQVANRIPNIKQFAQEHDIIIFVCGAKSSNGKILFSECQKANQNSFLISDTNEIKKEWFQGKIKSIGICGATSTPKWLMENVAKYVESLI